MAEMTARVLENLRERRGTLDDRLTRQGLAHTFSLARHRLHQRLKAAIAVHVRDDCLDAGSGRSPYKELLLAHGRSLTSIDIEDRAGELDLAADIQNMPGVADASFDTVLCSQVLEHVPRPWDAMAEFARVLRPGGRVLLTVPHLSMIHESPHDYYRYTRYGLRSLCERAGLEVELVQPTGGLFCFLSHTASLVWMSTVGALPALFWFAWGINYLLFVLFFGALDHFLGVPALFPCDYLLIARKSSPRAKEAAR